MKRTVGWIVTMGCIGLSSIATAEPAKQPAKAPGSAKAPVAQPAASSAATVKAEQSKTEKVAYSFSDQTKVDEFAKLWQQRQATVIRMSVLKAYFQEEQASLEKLNAQFAKDYNLDVAKNYRFDNERKAIIEVAGPPAEPQTAKTP